MIYLDILNHAVLSWVEDSRLDFEVYFKQRIEELLALTKNEQPKAQSN